MLSSAPLSKSPVHSAVGEGVAWAKGSLGLYTALGLGGDEEEEGDGSARRRLRAGSRRLNGLAASGNATNGTGNGTGGQTVEEVSPPPPLEP